MARKPVTPTHDERADEGCYICESPSAHVEYLRRVHRALVTMKGYDWHDRGAAELRKRMANP